jgi:hypothetical protein
MLQPKRLPLTLDIQYFSEPNPEPQDTQTQGATPDQNGQGQHTPADQQAQTGDGQSKPEHMIPKSRFDEVNDNFKQLQQQLQDLQNAKEQEELEAKKKKGEFEELYNGAQSELQTFKEQSETATARVEALEAVIQTLVDAELEGVPEDMVGLIPETFTAEQKLSWITTAKQKGLFGTQAPPVNEKENQPLGQGTNNQGQGTPDLTTMSANDLFKSAYGTKK